MKISAVQTNYSTFRMAKSEKKENYQKMLEKRAYIDLKTESLDNLGNLAFLGLIGAGIFDSDLLGKEHKPNKLTISLMIATGVILIASWIRKLQLSKQYDKENIA